MSPELGISFAPEKISVKEKMTAILDLLESRKKVTFSDLAARCADKDEIIATFLAVLEVVRLNLVGITQTGSGNTLQLFSR
jgi:segregation and condensation protein A